MVRQGELGQVDARPGAGAGQAGLGQADTAGACEEIELVRGVLHHVADELFPLRLNPFSSSSLSGTSIQSVA